MPRARYLTFILFTTCNTNIFAATRAPMRFISVIPCVKGGIHTTSSISSSVCKIRASRLSCVVVDCASFSFCASSDADEPREQPLNLRTQSHHGSNGSDVGVVTRLRIELRRRFKFTLTLCFSSRLRQQACGFLQASNTCSCARVRS